MSVWLAVVVASVVLGFGIHFLGKRHPALAYGGMTGFMLVSAAVNALLANWLWVAFGVLGVALWLWVWRGSDGGGDGWDDIEDWDPQPDPAESIR
jgi:hypothetical protein